MKLAILVCFNYVVHRLLNLVLQLVISSFLNVVGVVMIIYNRLAHLILKQYVQFVNCALGVFVNRHLDGALDILADLSVLDHKL